MVTHFKLVILVGYNIFVFRFFLVVTAFLVSLFSFGGCMVVGLFLVVTTFSVGVFFFAGSTFLVDGFFFGGYGIFGCWGFFLYLNRVTRR